MPMYDFHCLCGTQTLFSSVSSRDAARKCSQGHDLVRQQIYATFMQPDSTNYESPVTGRLITSRSQRKEDLKRAGAIPWEPGMNEHLARIRQQDEAATQAKFESFVDKTAGELRASGVL